MNLVDFILSLPQHWATAPIYAHGVQLPAEPGEEPRIAGGKSPLGRACRENLSPKFTAQWIKERPDQFKLSVFIAVCAPVVSSSSTLTATLARSRRSGVTISTKHLGCLT